MSKKNKQKAPIRGSSTPASSVDVTHLQALLEQFHAIAQALHNSEDPAQVEAALDPITSAAEAAQLALLKTLSREQNEDAADVLLALNEFSPQKEVRKEARRSLIRLQESHIYPQWKPPTKRTALLTMIEEAQALYNPPRFWKGVVTKSRDVGEVSLILLFEQGEDYREVRLMGFLLDFWTEGVKDYFTSVDSKRNIERFVTNMQSQTPTTDCSLAKGRSLIREALAIHKKFGTQPYKDFRTNQSLINKLILEAPELDNEPEPELEEDSDSALLDPAIEPKVIVTGFIEAEVNHHYKLAYAYLAKNSDLREGLPAEEWIARREQWAEEVQPGNILPGPVEELEAKKSKLWLPNPLNRGNTAERKEISVNWSMHMDIATTDIVLPEWPKATTFYKENKRYWFWATFTLVKEEEGWRIQSMFDEGTNAQTLSISELESRIKAEEKSLQAITKHHAPTDSDASKYLIELMGHSTKATHYYDALISKLPLDEASYLSAASLSLTFGEHERVLSYLERMLELFPKRKATTLREIAAIQLEMSDAYYKLEDETEELEEDEDDNVVDSELSQGDHFFRLAKASLEESLALDNDVTTHITLANMIIDHGGEDEELDEAEDHLLQAQTLTNEPGALAEIEFSLGEIELDREQYEHALRHFQQTLEFDPTYPNVWYTIGKAYQGLGNEEEALAAFNKGIEIDPTNESNYSAIATFYIQKGRVAESRAALERGLQAIPDSASLLVMLSTTYFTENPAQAEELLQKAESLDPDLEIVQMYRQVFEAIKASPLRKGQQGKKITGKKSKKR